MDEKFLLHSDRAVFLYNTYAKDMPIYDFHNHLPARDIAEKRRFKNLTELWLEGDHYKWRAMRAFGIDEELITGKEKSEKEKFLAWASVLPFLVGCPLYHWTALELERYFSISENLNEKTAEKIWQETERMLRGEGFDTVSLLEGKNVKTLCTTDDPADSLKWHIRIKDDKSISFKVLPSFRPDRILSIEKTDVFLNAIKDLEEINEIKIGTLDDLKCSLIHSLNRFENAGCRLSDHGFTVFSYSNEGENIEKIFKKALLGEALPESEEKAFKGDILRFLSSEYKKRDIAMQLHIGALRNVRRSLFTTLGPDAGGDSIGGALDAASLAQFLSDIEEEGSLCKTVLYNLNPSDNAVLSTMAVDFSPLVQFGAAWWFNDTISGMKSNILSLMENGLLYRSVGMLTDSRAFTSFTRHEYYRRILSDTLASLVERGEYPDDNETLGKIIESVSSKNAKEFFGF